MEEISKSMDGQSVINQYIVAVVANLPIICFGIAEGWVSPNVYLLTSDRSPLPSGKITMEEATWVASLMCLGCFFGNIFFGYITNKFGRKIPLILITIPVVISWIIVLFAPDVYYLYASRTINGFFGGGAYTIVPLFLSEIANDRIRGALVSSLVLSENVGMLLAFVFGTYFDFYMVPQFVIILLAVFVVLLLFFPETPVFLVKQNKMAQAEKSIRFYQNLCESEKEDKLVAIELNKLRNTITHDQVEKIDEKSFEWSELITNPALKAMKISLVLVILVNFSGCGAILSYTANIFEEAGSSVDPNVSTIIVGAIQLFGAIIVTFLVDRAGRKILFAVSNFGTALGLFVLGLYMALKSYGYPVEAFNWVPLLSFSFAMLLASLGIFGIPITVMSEIMPENVKDCAMSICMSLLWVFQFITIKYLPNFTDSLGSGSWFLFAGVCIACELFIIFFVPETKGKSREEIMESLR